MKHVHIMLIEPRLLRLGSFISRWKILWKLLLLLLLVAAIDAVHKQPCQLKQHVARVYRGVHCKTEWTFLFFSLSIDRNGIFRAVPIFIVSSVCLLIICLMYFRPLLKICLCGRKCPCSNRSRGKKYSLDMFSFIDMSLVGTPSRPSVHDNPMYVMNNGDLPDYNTVIKDTRPKDMTPPPYTFVTTHPNDFGIGERVTSAPPQYRSRNNSVAVIEPLPVVA